MKRNLFLLVLSVFFLLNAQSQIPPQAFNYSAVARDGQSNPIANQTIGIQISILQTTSLGSVVYSENHFVNTDQYGLFNLIIGAGAIQSGSMGTIDWSGDNYYLKVGMDANGGTNFLTMGTTQLISVPYALHAATADSLIGGSQNLMSVFEGRITSYTGGSGIVDLNLVNIDMDPQGLPAYTLGIYTIPSTGAYNVTSTFTGNFTNTVNLNVNGVIVASSPTTFNYSKIHYLFAGQTVYLDTDGPFDNASLRIVQVR